MPRLSPQPDLDLPSGEFGGRAGDARVGRNGQARARAAEVAPQPPPVAISSRFAELQRRLGASIDENSNLTAQVRRLETELRRSSATLARLRGELRGAVHDALTDPLTGLANRRSFALELEAVSARVRRAAPAQLVMVDIDHFKRVNDAHGHDVGDELLRIVGEVLRANVRRDGLVARVGGDEFGLLLRGASLRYTAGIAVRLCALLADRPLVLRGHPEVIERVTLSIGVADCRPGESGARWCARADAALYQAKRRGRNRISIARTPDLEFWLGMPR